MKKSSLLAAALLLCVAALYAQVNRLSNQTVNTTSSGGLIGTDANTSDFEGNVQLAMSNPDYMVTPGDIYSLAFVVGSNAVEYKIVVDSSYKIRVANLAVLDAAGKSYLSLKRQVEDIVTKNYPMSGVQFTLVTPAVFKVVVKGEVTRTREISAWALTRLQSLIQNNLTPYSSMRNVTVTSQNGASHNYDLFKAVRFGDLDQNPYLRPGDVITVNTIDKKVQISGAVKRPGEYELVSGENLNALVNIYAGGLKEQADTTRIELTRITDASDKTGEKLYLDESALESDFALKEFDKISIATLNDFRPVMFMEGAILQSSTINVTEEDALVEGSTRITVQFNSNQNYAFLIKDHKSYFDSAVCDTENAFIIRDGTTIPINIAKILYEPDYYTDLIVQPYDILRVPFRQYFVSVSGSVHSPGRYPYIPNRTYEYYIGLAGGFIKSQNSNDSVKIKDSRGKKIAKTADIPPEATINASTNSFTYFFNQYAPIFTTILSAITSVFTILVYIRQ